MYEERPQTQTVLYLRWRKNRQQGSRLTATCWCEESRWMDGHENGCVAFASITADKALKTLRLVLQLLKVRDAEHYRTHELRRRHGEDMR